MQHRYRFADKSDWPTLMVTNVPSSFPWAGANMFTSTIIAWRPATIEIIEGTAQVGSHLIHTHVKPMLHISLHVSVSHNLHWEHLVKPVKLFVLSCFLGALLICNQTIVLGKHSTKHKSAKPAVFIWWITEITCKRRGLHESDKKVCFECEHFPDFFASTHKPKSALHHPSWMKRNGVRTILEMMEHILSTMLLPDGAGGLMNRSSQTTLKAGFHPTKITDMAPNFAISWPWSKTAEEHQPHSLWLQSMLQHALFFHGKLILTAIIHGQKVQKAQMKCSILQFMIVIIANSRTMNATHSQEHRHDFWWKLIDNEAMAYTNHTSPNAAVTHQSHSVFKKEGKRQSWFHQFASHNTEKTKIRTAKLPTVCQTVSRQNGNWSCGTDVLWFPISSMEPIQVFVSFNKWSISICFHKKCIARAEFAIKLQWANLLKWAISTKKLQLLCLSSVTAFCFGILILPVATTGLFALLSKVKHVFIANSLFGLQRVLLQIELEWANQSKWKFVTNLPNSWQIKWFVVLLCIHGMLLPVVETFSVHMHMKCNWPKWIYLLLQIFQFELSQIVWWLKNAWHLSLQAWTLKTKN